MFILIRSLLITGAVSGIVGTTFWSLDQGFLKPFVLSIILQFIGFWIFNTISQRIFSIKERQLENERIAEFSKQGVEVDCAYCKTTNLVPVRFDVDNDFECINCGKPNAIYIGVTVTQKTTPLNVSPLMINTLNPDEQNAIDKLSSE
ncbi:MAG: hypothetical protein CMM25_01885 [Rhodospirillaceae bacterium]|nr:hypothetical protein [Rhodospirillaceae bacterium]|tara:strand:+ start:638 stop:1078 length:441 start_codon:yes stop_codon:yes gene_type:complete